MDSFEIAWTSRPKRRNAVLLFPAAVSNMGILATIGGVCC
jgi:hypothetical protein